MLLLIYAFILSIIGLIFPPVNLVYSAIALIVGDRSYMLTVIVGTLGIGLTVVFFFIMLAFIKYHFSLIEENKTTIEHLDEKRGNIPNVSYDMGSDFNWKFVFGSNKVFWFLPIDWGIGAPMGDGVVISKRDLNPKETSFNLDDYEYNNNSNSKLDRSWNYEQDGNPLSKFTK